MASADALMRRFAAAGNTLATAESLTGGLLADSFISVPGASSIMRGGIVAYATDLKTTLLGVDPALLAREGAVHPAVAKQMARGVRRRLGADYGVSTTGVAGPDAQDGHPVGTVHVAVATPHGVYHRGVCLPGDRFEVRAGAVIVALELLTEYGPREQNDPA